MSLEAFIEEQQASVEELEKERGLASWEASISGSTDDERRAAAITAEVCKRYSDPQRFEQLRSYPDPAEPDLARQRKLLINSFAANQMSASVIADIVGREQAIETFFSSFRAQLRGKHVSDNEIREILKSSSDIDERRDAWEASKQIGERVCGQVLELVAIRNRETRRLGYSSYYRMRLELQELDEDDLFKLLNAVAGQTADAYVKAKAEVDSEQAARFSITVDQIRPWHYSDPFFQDAPTDPKMSLDPFFHAKDLSEITRQFYKAIGFNIDPILERSDLLEKPGKNQHAFCTSIGRGTGDVRVLCNNRPNANWASTMLHEFGHAVYDYEIDKNLPYFLREVAHTMTTEAIAEAMGRFVYDPSWLRRYAGVSSDSHDLLQAARETNRRHLLIFAQWVCVMSHFERELYADPNQDLNRLWWDLVARFQRITPPEGRNKPDWAAKIHLALSPAYYHNYLLGEMTASQMLHVLKRRVVKDDDELVSSKKIGSWLVDNVFRHGARHSWNDLLERATGEPLNPRYFVDETST